MEFTAAGALLQSELLLITRERAAIDHYLPKLERCAKFIETRRDPTNNLFLAGPAGNLLAPSYAGYKKPDGTYGMAYLTGLSVTHIAFLDRLIELEKLAGRTDQARAYAELRDSARKGLDQLATEEGYFIKYQDPDGTRHGVFGAPRHSYFEASPNHDAICFRVVDLAQSAKIYRKLASIPGLRPYDLIVANAPSLDDMYEEPQGLWGFGTWVNGGHWTTCEARMIMAYYRLGQFDDARRAMNQILSFARQFRMDNPLVKFGSDVYQPGQPINITYDAFGAPAAMVRGLFDYIYRADGLTLVPQIPAGISRLEQKFPIRFGTNRIYLAVAGQGPISSIRVNGEHISSFDDESVFLRAGSLPPVAAVQILRGGAKATGFIAPQPDYSLPAVPELSNWPAAKSAAVIAPNELPLRIGADSDGGSRFAGEIARVAIYQRALSADEITSLGSTRSTSPLPQGGLLADWTVKPGANALTNLAGSLPAPKLVGTVVPGESPSGGAVKLSGEGYFELGSTSGLDLSKGATFYVLARPDTTNGRLVDKCPVGGATGFTFDTYPGNSLRLITDSGAVSAETKLAPGEWVHLAATVDDKGTSTLYVDGKAVASAKAGAAGALDMPTLLAKADRVRRFHTAIVRAGLADSYEAAHARLALRCLSAAHNRFQMLASGTLKPLPARSAVAADKLYLETVSKLCDGLEKVLNGYASSQDPQQKKAYRAWHES
jgi:hypothetical protein